MHHGDIIRRKVFGICMHDAGLTHNGQRTMDKDQSQKVTFEHFGRMRDQDSITSQQKLLRYISANIKMFSRGNYVSPSDYDNSTVPARWYNYLPWNTLQVKLHLKSNSQCHCSVRQLCVYL